MDCILINPSLIEIKKKARELLYTWDEIKCFINNDNLIVWFEDVRHMTMMKRLGIRGGLQNHYNIVICFKPKTVRVDINGLPSFDMGGIKNNKNLRRVIPEFEVIIRDYD